MVRRGLAAPTPLASRRSAVTSPDRPPRPARRSARRRTAPPRSRAASSSSSRSRPTSGESRKPRFAPWSCLRRTTVYASTGSAFPFTSIWPRASTSKKGSTNRHVSAVICTVPGSAVCSIRAATFTASPIAVYSRRRSEPTCPTITGPVWMPTRTSRSMPRSVRTSCSVGRDPGDDVEPRPDRALRVVLVRDRCAEEREDRVAHQSSERALIAVDRGDQPLERAVHDLRPIFGVQRLRHRGGALDVAEQHGDDTPLALHRSARAGGLQLGHQFPRQERVERGAAVGARNQGRSARIAEPGALGVGGPTSRAIHGSTIARPARW